MTAFGNMFHSARLKLTLYYLAVIAVFSLAVTVSIRIIAEHEYRRSNAIQSLQLRDVQWPRQFGSNPDVRFTSTQEGQAALVRQHLNQSLLVINVVAFTIGGLVSYWFAGRTLRPIEEAHEAQARFASDASHELRTPLTNMKLENEVFLRQKTFTVEETRELVTSNLEEIHRLEKLSSNLLALTQYDQADLVAKPVPITGVIAGATQPLHKDITAKQVKIVQHIARAKAFVHRDSIVQLLSIVLDNALKYGPEKGVITLTGQEAEGQYALTVRDEGPGIPADDLPHIFDRLYRGDKARSSKVSGFGLGLSLAQEIAQANQASLTAANHPDGGAQFTLTLPLAS